MLTEKGGTFFFLIFMILHFPLISLCLSVPVSPLMTESMERKKVSSGRPNQQFSNFLTLVIGCVLTGQEVLGGGAKVSVGLLQQLQSVFHCHLHRKTRAGEKLSSELHRQCSGKQNFTVGCDGEMGSV